MRGVAIVGLIGSGKTTAQRFFLDKGFEQYRLSQGIYDEADLLGVDKKDRVALQDLGDKMRKEGGNDVLAKKVLVKLSKHKGRFAIESIRNHHEMSALKLNLKNDMLVIAIEASIELRYSRVVNRKKQYNEAGFTFEEFQEIDKRDEGRGNDENMQNVGKCIAMADLRIVNEGTEKELADRLESVYIEHFDL